MGKITSAAKKKKPAAAKKPLTASGLRQNVYQILDQVLLTGEAVEIYRSGEVLRIEPPKRRKKRDLSKLPKRDLVVGDWEDLVHMDWSSEWRP